MKRTVILLLTVGLFMANVNDNNSQIHAQVMNREMGLLITPKQTTPVCPYCGESLASIVVILNHQAGCPYRYRIEYTYDAAGNRVKREAVWKVAPKVIEKQQALDKIQLKDSIQFEP